MPCLLPAPLLLLLPHSVTVGWWSCIALWSLVHCSLHGPSDVPWLALQLATFFHHTRAKSVLLIALYPHRVAGSGWISRFSQIHPSPCHPFGLPPLPMCPLWDLNRDCLFLIARFQLTLSETFQFFFPGISLSPWQFVHLSSVDGSTLQVILRGVFVRPHRMHYIFPRRNCSSLHN